MGCVSWHLRELEAKLPGVEGLIKMRSQQSSDDIEKGVADIKTAFKTEKPDVNQTVALVNGVMDKYNAVVTDITKDARSH